MDKAGTEEGSRIAARTVMPRVLKAIVKTAIVYVFFVIFSAFTFPFEGTYNLKAAFMAFFMIYLFFIFAIELTRGTIFQHIFSVADSLVMVFYFAYVLDVGIIRVSMEQFKLIIDLRFFLAIFILSGILSLAKNMLQLLNWLNEREETWLQGQVKSL